MARPDPREVMAVVARRGRVLRAMGRTGIEKRELIDALDVSRSTVDRSVRELEAIDLIERTGGEYRLTLPGRIALEEYDRFASRMDGLFSAISSLSSLPVDAPFDAAVLEDATVVRTERHSPHVPVTHLSDQVSRATETWAVAPAVLPQQVSVYHERILEDGLEARIVATEAVLERLLSAYAEEFEETLATGRLHVRQVDGELPPYSLLVVETPSGPEMGMLFYGENGATGYVGNDSPHAVEWARGQISNHWERATPLTTSPASDD